MKRFLEQILPQSLVDQYKIYRNKHPEGVIKSWENKGKPLPPPHVVKQKAIQAYQKRSGYPILVETGTYKGDMIIAQKDFFKKIYSIELSKTLFERAKKRFRNYPFVSLLQGNSGDVIAQVLQELKEPAIFWLDGHFSGGITATIEKYSPIQEEMQLLIANNQLQHIILIDDARVFDGTHGYPTIPEVKQLASMHLPRYHFSVADDIIRLVPEKFS